MSIETNDFGELQKSATGWDQEYSQLSPGRFRGSLDLREVGSTQILREFLGRKTHYKGTAPYGGFGFAIPLNQPDDAHWVGEIVTTSTVIIQAPGKEANLVTSDHWDSIVLAVSEEDVRAITSALSGRSGINKRHHGTSTLNPDAAKNVRRAALDFLRQSKDAQANDDARLTRMADQVIKLFLLEIVSAQADAKPISKPAKPTQLVMSATDLVMANPAGGVGLVDICRKLGVSLRTLQYAFRDATGMSAATWLRALRLNRVHKSLKRSSPQDVLIKQVAVNHGFLHQGNFSALYHRHFGCLPSETLDSA